MNSLPPPMAIEEVQGPVTAETFAALRKRGQPAILRGLVADWPAVRVALQGDAAIVGYMTREHAPRPVAAIATKPGAHGRFFYNDDVSGLNFVKGTGHLEMFLADLLKASDMPDAPGLAVQSENIGEIMPAFARENRLDLLPSVPPRIWIGNRIRVAPHYDVKENVACCVAGRRRFTLFPPDQIANLYPGPFELTPAGTPVSMVDPLAPDLAKYPRFERAWQTAQQSVLEPGDAIYIPYCWWHGVKSLEPVSILVNYWWNEAEPQGIAGPYDALLHAIAAYRHLPPAKREVWRGMLDYYVFEGSGDPAAHLPPHAKGVIGPPEPGLFAKMRDMIRGALG